MASHPDVRPLFARTDFAEQHRLLRHGLNSLLMYAEDNPLAVKTLTRIRDSHSQRKMNIAPALYRYWMDSLLKAISEFDREFTVDLERVWRQVLEPGVEYIKSGYADISCAKRSVA
jgi:hemoglobin-like flavoprotein